MAQQQISTSHRPGLAHHVTQGRAWLDISAEGESTAALSYSAFELRFAIERLAIHYWATLLQRCPEEHEMREIESFKRVERRIYELAGHQREIDGHFEFMRIVLEALKIEALLITPKIGSLAKYWQECSELCHIAWPLACSVAEVRKLAYLSLSAIAEELTMQVQSMGWPTLQEQGFAELRDRYIAGTAMKVDVLDAIARSGLWARVEYPDGREPHFLGEPVPVSAPKDAT
jgi:hypothetical protein